MNRKILTTIGVLLAVAIVGALALPLLITKTNCGGNSYALTACATFAVAANITAQDNHLQFEPGKIGEDMRRNFLMFAENHWGMNGADFLVKTNFFVGSSSNREVIIVSERKFGNVPQSTIWNFYHQNQAHAVGYSDGTTGLISPEQLTNLNLAGFISLSHLVTHLESDTSKP